MTIARAPKCKDILSDKGYFTGPVLLVSAGHLCDLSVLFVQIQKLVTIFVILCETLKEFERHREDVTKLMSHKRVCRHHYSLNNHLVGLSKERPTLDDHPKAHIHEIRRISCGFHEIRQISCGFHLKSGGFRKTNCQEW